MAAALNMTALRLGSSGPPRSGSAGFAGTPISLRARLPQRVAAGGLAVTAKMDNRKEIAQNVRDATLNKAQRTQSRTLTKYCVQAMQEMKDAPLVDEGLKKLEGLIAKAYQSIDKCSKTGALHKNTAARRKSRIARAKRTFLVAKGAYTPSPVAA